MGILRFLLGPSTFERNIMATLQELIERVERNTNVVDAAAEVIAELRQDLIEAGTDPEKLQALVDKLDESNNQLATAIAANTPADPELPVDPVVPSDPEVPSEPTDPVQG